MFIANHVDVALNNVMIYEIEFICNVIVTYIPKSNTTDLRNSQMGPSTYMTSAAASVVLYLRTKVTKNIHLHSFIIFIYDTTSYNTVVV